MAVISLSAAVRGEVLAAWRKGWAGRGVSRKRNDAHFAHALAMGMGSGLEVEESLDLAAELLKDVPAAAERCGACRVRLEAGTGLAEALRDTETLPAASCRLLALGLRSGTGDRVMAEIARRSAEEADLALERKLAKVEPALVLGTSLLVGAILLSVMLPLMDIMTAIG